MNAPEISVEKMATAAAAVSSMPEITVMRRLRDGMWTKRGHTRPFLAYEDPTADRTRGRIVRAHTNERARQAHRGYVPTISVRRELRI